VTEDRDLQRKNGRLLAERLGWPDGAIEACERLEDEYGLCVAWYPRWRMATPGFDNEAGFYAWVPDDQPGYWAVGYGYVRRKQWYGATADELAAALDRQATPTRNE